MSDTRVHELLSIWEQAPAADKPTPEGLCADHPELIDEVRRHIVALRAADAMMSARPHGTALPGAGRPPAAEHGIGAPAFILPGYQIERELGRGGQAVVYEAVQVSTARRVAIKVLISGRFARPEEQKRLEREAQILAALDHPNIVRVVDRGRTPDGYYYLVMSFVTGRPLNEWLDRHPHLTPAKPGELPDFAEALRLFLKICHAVNTAHLRGVVHRDLKPGNILVDDAGEPHVLDFGLARPALDLGEHDPDSGSRPVTIAGQFLGSLPWASPEQADGTGGPIDARSDVYSLGVILYQFLTGGRFPYPVAGTMREVLDNILKAQPVPPSKVLAPNPAARRRARGPFRRLSSINPGIEAIVLKALNKRREDRYQSAGELARDVENYLAGRPTVASHSASPAARTPAVPDRPADGRDCVRDLDRGLGDLPVGQTQGRRRDPHLAAASRCGPTHWPGRPLRPTGRAPDRTPPTW